MDQRTICLYLNRKELSAQAIHDEFVQVLGFDAVVCSTMTSYLRTSHWRAQNEEQHSDPIQILSTTQFFKPLIKSCSHQCENSQSPCAFHLQQFCNTWPGPWDLSSSIYTGLAIRLTYVYCFCIEISWKLYAAKIAINLAIVQYCTQLVNIICLNDFFTRIIYFFGFLIRTIRCQKTSNVNIIQRTLN
jgi:hypothetical protein